MSTKLAFMDTETVHIKPGPATIWELAVILRTEEDADREYAWQIRPDLTTADPGALKVGGYYSRCLISGCTPGSVITLTAPVDEDSGDSSQGRRMVAAELAGDLGPMLNGAHLIAANPGFDAGHMAAFLRFNGECPAWDYHLTDIGSLVRGRIAGLGKPLPFPLKVADAAIAVGIDPGQYEAHTALGDARMVRDIYDAVTGRPA